MTIGSLFDGAGGFPLAAEMCGGKALWASEIENFPIKVTSKRFPGMKHLGDITKISGSEIEPVDVITFGSPCQDLSVAGKRAGLDGSRSGLFMEATRIIREMRQKTNGEYPKVAVWENVPGAFSSNGGEDFRTVLEELAKIKDGGAVIPRPPKKWQDAGLIVADGYSVAWRILDAQYWGVPQRRKRIFLVADFRGQCAGQVLFEREGLRRDFEESREAWERDSSNIENCVGDSSRYLSIENHPNDSRVTISEDGNVQTLSGRMGTGGNNTPLVLAIDGHNHKISEKESTFGINCGISTGRNGVLCFRERCGKELVCYGVDCRKGSISDVNGTLQAHPSGGYSVNCNNTVLVYCIGNGQPDQLYLKDKVGALNCMHDEQCILVGLSVRRLTPKECGRLQGMPDWWCSDIAHSDSAEYKMWGNGMALPNVLYVMEGVSELLDGRHDNRDISLELLWEGEQSCLNI